VSRAQALGAGLTAAQVDRHVARRRWCPLHPRVYLAAGHPLTDEARVRAAALWAGDGAVVVGAAAVWWHGLAERAPATVGVAVPGRGVARAGVAARRRDLAARDVVTLRGLAVPVRPLALLDAAVEAGAAGPALLRSVLRDQVGIAELRAVAARSAGTATAARLLAAVTCTRGGNGPGGNGQGFGIATVHCEHRPHPRGRPGRPPARPGAP
jgi:hypothetical protein